jgi:hypothetical protein
VRLRQERLNPHRARPQAIAERTPSKVLDGRSTPRSRVSAKPTPCREGATHLVGSVVRPARDTKVSMERDFLGVGLLGMRRVVAMAIGVGLVVCAVGQVSASAGVVGARDRVARSRSDAGCNAAAPRISRSGSPVLAASRARAGGWSHPVSLARAGTATEWLGLAATVHGSLLAGWVQGLPPEISSGGGSVPPRPERTSASIEDSPASMQELEVADGSISSGFQRPVELSSGPSGSLANLQVTLSGPDVGYAVWQQQPGTTVRVSVLCGGAVAVSNRQLLVDAVPLALFPLTRGRAALVYDQYGHGTPFLDYAIVSPTGAIGSVARIAHPGTHDTAATELSVNTRGELIAAWVHNDGASPPGSLPSSPGFLAAKLVVAVCKPELRCARPQTVRLGQTKPACINPTVAISPDGTTTVIAAADDWGVGCNDPLGVRASITPGSRTGLQPMRLISDQGDYPSAEPDGDAGTVVVLNPGLSYSDSIGSAFVPAHSTTRPRTQLLDNGGFWNTGQQSLTPVNSGWYLVTWTHANSNDDPTLSLRAALGHNGRVGPPSVAVSAHTPVDQYLGATSGHGDAIILFSGSTDHGNGAPYPYSTGLYATALHP